MEEGTFGHNAIQRDALSHFFNRQTISGKADADIVGEHDEQRTVFAVWGIIGNHGSLDENIVKTCFQVFLSPL